MYDYAILATVMGLYVAYDSYIRSSMTQSVEYSHAEP
jgi:hypothetical protein